MHKNSTLLILASLLFLFHFAGSWIYGLTGFSIFRPMLVDYAYSAGQIVLIFLLVLNGTFIHKDIYQKAVWGLSIVFGLSLIMKILHWQWASEILIVSLAGFPLVYSTHFIQKNKKGIIDLVKYAWTLAFFIGYLGKLLHWQHADKLLHGAMIIMLVLTGDLVIQMLKRGKADEN